MSQQSNIEQHFRLWYKPLCLYALHFLGNLEESEDVVQEVFCTLLRKADEGYPEVTNLKSYLYSSVKNRCLDILKSASSKVHREGLDSAEYLEQEDDNVAKDNSIDQARIWSAIDSLPKSRRQILIMSKVQGKKYSEIAKELGISENTVRNQMAKALESIRSSVKKVISFLFSL